MSGINLNPASASILSDPARQQTLARTTLNILRDQDSVRAARAQQALRTARSGTVTPEQAVRGQQLATTALQSPTFRLLDPSLMDTLEARVKGEREAAMLRDNPRTANWLTSYDNAIIAHDDVENIGAFESLGNAVGRGVDTLITGTISGAQLDINDSAIGRLRDSTQTLDEIMADERRVSAEDILKFNNPEPTKEQIDAQAENNPALVDWSANARGLWRYLQSRNWISAEEANALADAGVKEQARVLEQRTFTARDREAYYPTATWRQDIERQIGELDKSDPAASFVGLMKIIGGNGIRGPQYLMEVAAESGVTIAAAVAATAATRSPGVGAIVAGGGSYAYGRETFFDELVDTYGHDLNTAEGRAAFLSDPRTLTDLRDKSHAYGIVVGLLDGMSSGAASRVLVNNPVGNMAVQMVVQSAMGGSGELLGRLAAGEPVSWTDVILEALAEVVTAPLEVGGMTVHGTQRQLSRVRQSRDSRTLFGILSGAAEASTLRARDRERFAGAINEVTKNGPIETVYVDPAAMEEMFQSGKLGMTLDEFFANVPGLDIRAFQEARDNGSLFTMPTGVYAAHVAGSALDLPFQQHIKFNPDDMSQAEAKQFAKDMKRAQEQLGALSDNVETVIGKIDGELIPELDRLTTQIIEESGVTRDAAAKQAAVFVNFARVRAEREGMTTAEYLRRFALPQVGAGAVAAVPDNLINPDHVMDLLSGADVGGTVGDPAMSLIVDELDRIGIPPDVASRDDVLAVIRALHDKGLVTADISEADEARPTTVGREDGEELMQTATLRNGEEDASEWGIDPTKRNGVRDIALALEARQRKKYGRTSRKQRGAKTVDKFGEWMADEIEFELQTPGAAATGWYTTKYQAALDRLAGIFPELKTGKGNLPGLRMVKTPEDARAIFTLILAVTSNGAKVMENFRSAVAIYAHFRETGVLEEQGGRGDRAAHTRTVFERYSRLLAETGNPTALRDRLLTEMTVSEANKLLVKEGMPKVSGMPASMTVPFSATVLGAKLGAFYANLSGSVGYLTMDLWWTRTINRYRGDVLPKVSGLRGGVNSKGEPIGLNHFKHLIGRPEITDKVALNLVTDYAQAYADRGYKDGTEIEKAANTLYKAAFLELAEQPEGAADRAFMVEVVKAAQQKVYDRTGRWFSIADMQALIWYYEKRLYTDMGAKASGDFSYEEAADAAAKHYLSYKTMLAQSAAPEDAKRDFLRGSQHTGVVYHGTLAPFTSFDPRRVGSRDGGFYGNGFYFTTDIAAAEEYAVSEDGDAGHVIEALVSIKNPFVFDLTTEGLPATVKALRTLGINPRSSTDVPSTFNLVGDEPRRFTAAAKAAGYDGAVVRRADWQDETATFVDEIVVFDNRQIKSPDARSFDTSSADIFNQAAPPVTDDALPNLEKASPGRVPGVRDIASRYMADNALPIRHQATYAAVDIERAKRIAAAYDAMEHAPNDPEVKAAYQALADETMAQFEALQALGLTFDWITGEDPYASPADAIRDMQENGHLWVFPTDLGFGSSGVSYDGNPLLKPTGITIAGRATVVNDIFRIVHDVFGHGSEGASFGPRGEENAWQAHVRMFSPLAARAMTTETRGQNSWVNYGPKGEANRANPKDTTFADQKAGLLPEWVSTEGIVEDVAPRRSKDDPARLEDFTGDLSLENFQRPGWAIFSVGGEENMTTLRAQLENMGKQWIEMEGFYAGQPDGTSFLVIGLSESWAKNFGAQYNQESILTKDGLVYTDGTRRANVPFTGLVTGDKAKGEYYSVMPNGTAWSLDLQFGAPTDQVITDATGTGSYYGLHIENGDAVLTHWSTEPLSSIDPAEAGTGALRGPERRRSGPRKVFFGANEGKSPTAYKRESKSLGDFKHTVRIPAKDLYPWQEDPDNLADKLPSGLSQTQRLGAYEDAIKAAGYKGYFVIAGPIGDVAVSFGAVDVAGVEEFNQAPITLNDRFYDWFRYSIVKNADGSPMALFHGTQSERVFEGFRSLSHFGTRRAAHQRLDPLEGYDPIRIFAKTPTTFKEHSRVIPVFLSVENPLHIKESYDAPWQDTVDMLDSAVRGLRERGEHDLADDLLASYDIDLAGAYRDFLITRYGLDENNEPAIPNRWEYPSVSSGLTAKFLEREVITQGSEPRPLYFEFPEFWATVVHNVTGVLKAAGYDGFTYVNEVEDAGSISYVTFDAAQAKSVWNRGNWSALNSDLLEQQKRGSIILPREGGTATINIFATGDLSTALHEGGHFFLWSLQQQRDAGLAEATKDYEAIREWWKRNSAAIATEAGVDEAQVQQYLELGTTGSGSVDRAIHVALHEQFARGFEAYAMEGKSPSHRMRAIFESFATWLLSVYKQAKSLNVNIDDDIRAVFDRMMATDSELQAGMDREAVDSMIAETAKQLGLDEQTYQRLVTLSNEARDEGRQATRAGLLAAEARMRSQSYRARYNEIESEEREAVISKPVNRAIQWLGYGRWLGGERPQEMPLELRFDTQLLIDEYGEEVLNKLPRGRRPAFQKDTGLSADEVAGWFGFNSGAELIKAMTETPNANEEIKARTKARAAKELDDVAGKPGEVEELVAEAMHGEKRGQVIVAELRAINRLSGGRAKRMTTRAMASQIAKQLIAKMPTREALQSHRYLAAERANAEAAARLLAEGKIDEAFEAKRRQLIQHHLYSESKKVEDMVGKLERLAGRLKKKDTRKKLANDYLGAIDDILETYRFTRTSGAADVRRERLLAYIKMMNESGRANELNIPDHVLQAAKSVPYKTLSVQRLTGVYESLVNIEHAARFKQTLLDRKQERELQEVIDELADTMRDSVRPGKAVNRVQTRKDRVMFGVKGYFNLVRNADTILRRLDGWKDRGVFYRIFKDRIDAAETDALTQRTKVGADLDQLFSVYDRREREKMAIRKVHKGYAQAMSKWDIISVALNMGNKDNLERMMSKDSRGSLKREEVDALVDTLDKRDWDFVQSVWDYLDSALWPQIKAREERMTGVAPTKVDPMEVVTKFGVYRGGYYPIVYDSRFSATVGEERNQELMMGMMAGRFGKAQTKNGHTKERAKGGGGRTVELGMHVLFGHINHVIHDLAFSEAVSQTWSMLQDKRVKGLFEEANLLEDHQALELWVQDVAAGPAAGTHVMAGMLRRMKSGFTMSKLAFNLSTVALQITGVTQSMVQVGTGNMLAGYTQYAASPLSLAAAVAERSPFMAERQKTFQRDMYDLLNGTSLDPLQSRLSTVGWYVMQAGFYAMQKVQFYSVDVPTWLAAHKQGLDQGMTDDEAALHADRMVARAQASGLYADRAAIERGTLGRSTRQNEFLRLFTALGSYMFAKFNVANEVLGRTARDLSDTEKNQIITILKGATDLVMLFTVEAILYGLIKGRLPDPEDEKDDEWPAYLAKQTALSILSVFPFVRDAASAAQGYSGGGAYGSIAEVFGASAQAAGNVATGEAGKRDARTANDLLGIAAPGYPSTAMWRLIDGLGLTGNEPSVPAAVLGR